MTIWISDALGQSMQGAREWDVSPRTEAFESMVHETAIESGVAWANEPDWLKKCVDWLLNMRPGLCASWPLLMDMKLLGSLLGFLF